MLSGRSVDWAASRKHIRQTTGARGGKVAGDSGGPRREYAVVALLESGRRAEARTQAPQVRDVFLRRAGDYYSLTPASVTKMNGPSAGFEGLIVS